MYALCYTRNAAVFSWGIGCRLADSCCGRRHRSVPRPRILTRRDEKGLAYASFCTQYRAGIVYIVLLYSCSDRISNLYCGHQRGVNVFERNILGTICEYIYFHDTLPKRCIVSVHTIIRKFNTFRIQNSSAIHGQMANGQQLIRYASFTLIPGIFQVSLQKCASGNSSSFRRSGY